MSDLLRILFNSIQTGSVYALAALGIVLIFRTSKTTNFAQGIIGTFNAYVAASLFLNQGVSIWVAALVALLTAFLTGVIIDRLIMRSARKATGMTKPILTLGIIMVLVGLIPILFGVQFLTLPSFIPTGSLVISGIQLRHNTLFVIALSTLLMGGLFWFIQYTRWGLATRVTAADETTSQLMGVPTQWITMISWAVAAMLGTLSALFIAPSVGVQPNMMLSVQISAFFAGTLGGFSTFFGPVVGAYLIAFMSNFTGFYISDIWGNVMVYSLILVFLYFKPYGLFGKKPTKKV
jgi:branched-chain amino acid transport system permease protein